MVKDLHRKWGGYEKAAEFSGLSTRLLEDLVAKGLIESSLVTKPGCKRGVRVINLESLDAYIAKGIGEKFEMKMNEGRGATKGKGGR
jgi:hypothetical protein